MKRERRSFRISPFRVILFGFVGVILLGTLLLMLPFSSRGAGGASFPDALFTATSAVCVTGLVVQDTATYWSGFGQVIILLLIQIGGLGVVTVAASVVRLTGKKIGLRQRSLMQEATAAPQMGGIVRLTGFIVKVTFLVEGIGAVLFSFVFCPEFGFWQGLWYAVFHAISAFCNAGFDLMGVRAPFSSLTTFATHPLVNTVVMLLIVLGGIGFLTWEDMYVHKWRLSRYRMQSKVILAVTAVLIFLPAVYYFFFEFTEGTVAARIWYSLFQSVTARTAGFNTVDLAAMRSPALLVMICLMLIGGSPGSTAGGMKTTTVAVLGSSAVSVFRRREHAHFFGRRIPTETFRNAAAILIMYMVLFIGSGIVICHIEGLPLLSCLYETASAIGTVGTTLGITGQVSMVSRGILIGLMLFGRVGGLTMIYAALSDGRGDVSRLPEEKITVG